MKRRNWARLSAVLSLLILGGNLIFHPFGFAIWFLLPLAIWALLAGIRQERWRGSLGKCAGCGNDLHGSKGRCPECGKLIPPGLMH
jgi:hypothetical protein